MKRKEKKKIMIIGGIVGAVILISMTTVAILSAEKDLTEEEPTSIDEFAEVSLDLEEVDNVMIEDGSTVYWNLGRPGNGSGVYLITNIQILLTWSDDEPVPVARPMYTNTPDRFTLSVEGVPLLQRARSGGNETNQTDQGGLIRQSTTSEMGSTRLNLNLLNNPIPLERMDNGSGNETDDWQWDPEGSAEKGDTGFFVNVSCVAGDIEGRRPALLRYTDPGDEINMNIQLSYKLVPQEVIDNWIKQNSGSD